MTSDASPFRPGGQYFGPLVGVVALAVVAGLGSYFFFGAGQPTETEPVAAAPAPPRPTIVDPPAPTGTPVEELILPPLDESDSLVRTLVGALTSHPAFAAWLIPDDLLRTFVFVVENIAEGNNPTERLGPLRPTQRFATTEAGGSLTVDPASYTRYNMHAEIVASINPVGAAEIYRSLRPLIRDAYAELGHPDDGFDDTLARAIANLLETPVLEREPRLVARAAFHEFEDPAFEDLQPIQKQLMAMGPRNVRAVQASVVDIARELGIDTSRLPIPEVIR